MSTQSSTDRTVSSSYFVAIRDESAMAISRGTLG